MHLVENINDIDWWRATSQHDMITEWWKLCQNVAWDVNTSWVRENYHICNFISTKLLEMVDNFTSIDCGEEMAGKQAFMNKDPWDIEDADTNVLTIGL